MATRILIFGDSIVQGTWDTQGGWVDRLKRDFHKITVESAAGEKYQLFNLGIGGETSKGLKERVEQEILSRKSPGWDLFAIVSIGLNDTRVNPGATLPQVLVNDYRINLINILDSLASFTDRIVLIGTTPVASDRVDFKGNIYSSRTSREYNEVAIDVAEQLGIYSLDIFDSLLENDYLQMLYKDGVHPDDNGHDLIYRTVREKIINLVKSDIPVSFRDPDRR